MAIMILLILSVYCFLKKRKAQKSFQLSSGVIKRARGVLPFNLQKGL